MNQKIVVGILPSAIHGLFKVYILRLYPAVCYKIWEYYHVIRIEPISIIRITLNMVYVNTKLHSVA